MVLVAQTFCYMPLGMGGGAGFVASVKTEEATRGSIGGGLYKASFLCCFEVEGVPLGLSSVLFFIDLSPWVFTIFKSLGKEQKQKLKKKNESFLALRGK